MLRTTMLGALAAGLMSLSAAAPAQQMSRELTERELAEVAALEERQLVEARASYPQYFAEAYARYPEIPRGILEAIAWSNSRWQHLAPSKGQESHHHMPSAYGVMGLYGGNGFADQVGRAARLLKVDRAAITGDPRANILAAAALLADEIYRQGAVIKTAEDMAPILARFAGFTSPGKKPAIDSFARDSFAFDVLLSLDRGVNDQGAVVPEVPMAWERVFDPDTLVKLRAPFVRLNLTRDSVEVDGYRIDPITGTLKHAAGSEDGGLTIQSTDYGPAIWDPAHSSNYTAWRNSSVSAVTIHTAQGSYAGTISWFKNSSANVSAHYVIRSSDGQVTQMVREAHRAWHVGAHNDYTVGIEHEGYVSSSSWYTTAMYNSSSSLVRNLCGKYSGISCPSAYDGPSHSGVVVLPTSIRIKGHQHYSSQTHTDPGIHWDWPRYHSLLNPGSGGGSTSILDSFESSVGHFFTSPTYSGSTVGISTTSTAQRYCSLSRNGNCSLQVKLVDDPNTSADWRVRLLSGAGSPSNNVSFNRSGRIGFWIYGGGSGLQTAVTIDDSDGTERSTWRSVPSGQWTFMEWDLSNSSHWNAWFDGNGAITASSVSLDGIWLSRSPQTSWDVFMYIDDVQVND